MTRLVLFSALLAVSAVAQSPDGPAGSGWGGAVGVRVESFASGREPWQESRAVVQRRFAGGAAALEVGHARRNGASAPLVGTDLYAAAGRRGYGNLRVQWAPEATTVARLDVLAEGYLALGGGWEGSAGLRRVAFAEEAVTLGTASAAVYTGNWLTRVRAVVSPGGVTGVSTSLSSRYLFEGVGGLTAPFVEATVGQGQEPVVGPDGEPAVRQSFVVAVRGQRRLAGPLGGTLGASYTADGTLTRWGLDVGVVARF